MNILSLEAFPASGEVLAIPECLLLMEGSEKPSPASSSALAYSRGAAAAAIDEGPVLLLGGASTRGRKYPSNIYLAVRILSCASNRVRWDGRAVNSNGVMNRQHLAVAAMGNGTLWGFGGETSYMEIASEPFRVTIDDEGVNIKPMSITVPSLEGATSDSVVLRRKGHCAVPMGPSRAVAVLFGGITTSYHAGTTGSSLRTLNDVLLVRSDETKSGTDLIVETMPSPSDSPSPRAYFSYSVLGSLNQYLLISGGIEIKENGQAVPLDDVWLLDLTRKIPELNKVDAEPTAPAAAGGKGKASGKGAAAVTEDIGLKWTRLSSKLPTPMFEHISIACKTKDDNYTISIAGGICQARSRPINPVQLSVQLGVGGLARDVLEAPAANIEGRSAKQSLMLRNSLCGAALHKNGNLSCYFIFCEASSDEQDEVRVFCVSCGPQFEVSRAVGESVQRDLQQLQSRSRNTRNHIMSNSVSADGACGHGEGNPEEDGVATIEHPNGDRYRGQIKSVEDKIYDGKGEMWYADGSYYKGDWRDGQRAGRGLWRSRDGSEVYEGQFTADMFNGQGTLTNTRSNGETEVICGSFVDGILEGQGSYFNKGLGHMYEGAFQNGLRHGFGVLYRISMSENSVPSLRQDTVEPQESPRAVVATCPDSGRPVLYTGMWEHGKPQGQGILSFEIQDDESANVKISARYEGELLDGLPHGTGECFFANGAYFVGQWRRGLRNGFGTFKQPNGDSYEGKWIADKRCGKGKWTSMRGDIIEGTWDENLPNGSGVHREVDGGLYEGTFARGRYHGSGTFTAADGSVYVGEWRQGLRHGRGEWTGPARTDGEIAYRGDWADGLRCGRGTARYVSGEAFTGVFIDDRPKK